MTERPNPANTTAYPPVGSPDRYDRIVSRGRTLRRRRRYGALGAGVGGTAAVIAVAMVVFGGSGSGSNQVVADDSGETATTSTTVPAPPESMTVDISAGTDPVLVVVTDPAQIVSPESRQCVLVTIADGDSASVAEGHGCNDVPASDGAVPVDVVSSDTSVGCAVAVERADPAAEVPTETALASTTFSVAVPADMPAGDYTVTVSATSGVGDGCAGSDPASTEIERFVEVSAPLRQP